jgi:hypothetical protein
MTQTRPNRPKAPKPAKPSRPEVVKPVPIDKTAFKINSLKQTVANQAELIADQQATIQELTQFIQSNAELLELEIVHGPVPPDSPPGELASEEEVKP